MISKRKQNENSSKVNFTKAFYTFRDIVSLYLETPTVLFQNFAFFELGLDEILGRNLVQNGRSVHQNLKTLSGAMLCAIDECFDRHVHLRGLMDAYTVHIRVSQSLLSDIYTRLISFVC